MIFIPPVVTAISTGRLRSRSSTDLFFALWPDDAIRERIAVETASLGGRVTAAANLHMSLGFLSRASCDQVAEFIRIGNQLRFQPAPLLPHAGEDRDEGKLLRTPLELQLTHIEYWRDVGIAALVAQEVPGSLLHLVTELRAALRSCGLNVDHRPFRAHIAVSRHISDFRRRTLARPIEWKPHCLALVEPQLADRYRVYHLRETWSVCPPSAPARDNERRYSETGEHQQVE